MANITQVLREERNMATMNTAMIAAGMDQLLSQPGPYTVFVPSDLAFGKLEQGVFRNLLLPENKSLLADFLNHHIVSGQVGYKELTNGARLTTLHGNELSVQVLGSTVMIDGATVQNRDVVSSNGVLHSLNTVLVH